MIHKQTHLLGLLLLLSFSARSQPEALRQTIAGITQGKQADVGVAIQGPEAGDTLTVNGTHHYPMQSVYKFHLALAVLHQADKGTLALDRKLDIAKRDLQPDTWSPLRDAYPNGDVSLPVGDILRYTVSHSDNNGCDILFRLVGGPRYVNDYIHGLGIKDVAIVATEEEMHAAAEVQFANWSTPGAMVRLLEKFYAGSILSEPARDFLWKLLVDASTGSKKIRGLLPAGAVAGHKSGFSGTDARGIIAAHNDVGIVRLPDGRHFSIAVFVTNSKEGNDGTERIVAEIARAAYDHFAAKP